MNEIQLVFTILAVAIGCFAAGQLWEMRQRPEAWQNGFNAAKKIYGLPDSANEQHTGD